MSSETESVTDGYIDFFLLSLVEREIQLGIQFRIKVAEINGRGYNVVFHSQNTLMI